MVNTKPKNVGITTSPNGRMNSAYVSSNQDVYSISRNVPDSSELHNVESTNNLIRNSISLSQPNPNNLLSPELVYLEANTSKVDNNNLSNSSRKCINKPKVVIPLIILGILISIGVIVGVVYAIVSSKSSDKTTNDFTVKTTKKSTSAPSFTIAPSTNIIPTVKIEHIVKGK